MGSGKYKKSKKSHGEGKRGTDGDDRTKKSSSTVVGADDGNGGVGSSPNINVFGSMTVDEKLNMIAELSEQVLEDPTKAFHQERVTTTTPAPPRADITEKDEDDDDTVNNIKIRNKKKSKYSKQGNDETSGPALITTTTRLPSKIQQLLDLGRTYKNGGNEYVASLAIMSLLALFKDIIPTYRIRVPTTAERESTIVSQETKQLWDYERALITYYQQYLQLLEKTWDNGNTTSGVSNSEKSKSKKLKKEAQQKQQLGQHDQPSRLAVTAMLSLCELFKSAFHFNFRSNILQIVVKQMNHRTCNEVSVACCLAVEYVFQNDSQGEVAMETARSVSKLIKDTTSLGSTSGGGRWGNKGSGKGKYLSPNVVKTFIKLPLRVHVDEAQAAKLATIANAKKRKRDREIADIESEIKEGSASVDKMLLARCQSDTLQAVIMTYFRILKSHEYYHANNNINSNSAATLRGNLLLPAALEGLAKFAHLINIDTVVDLLHVLKQLLLNVDTFPLNAALNCLLTAFQTLEGPGREMQIDPKEYITPLYSQLARLGTTHGNEGGENGGQSSNGGHHHSARFKNTKIMLQCLDSAFLKRREYSMVRVGAFLKQIFTVAQHAPPVTSIPLLAIARQIIQRYNGVHQLFETEHDVIASGQYSPEVADPEHSNPFSTVAWELANLKFHINPAVAMQAEKTSTLKMLQMPSEAPERLFSNLVQDLEEVHIPFRRAKKKHPLASKSDDSTRRFMAVSKGGGRIQHQARFITPRKTILTLLPPTPN